MIFAETLHKVRSIVRRSAIHDQDFHLIRSLLREDRIQGFRQKLREIVDRNWNGKLHRVPAKRRSFWPQALRLVHSPISFAPTAFAARAGALRKRDSRRNARR